MGLDCGCAFPHKLNVDLSIFSMIMLTALHLCDHQPPTTIYCFTVMYVLYVLYVLYVQMCWWAMTPSPAYTHTLRALSSTPSASSAAGKVAVN